MFANVNTGDNKFLKYIPDKFLSEEQVAAKRAAQKADYTKYGRYKEVFDGKPEQKFSLSDPLTSPQLKKWFGDWQNSPETASKVGCRV